MKTKTRTYGDKVYTKVRGLNVPEDDECESFTIISIGYWLVYKNKYYGKVYLDTTVLIKLQTNKWQIILMKIFLKIRYYKCCITIELTWYKWIDRSKECIILHYCFF